MNSSQSYVEITLPNNYKIEDFLNFHRRDFLAVSERVTVNGIEKAIVWLGNPAVLKFTFVDSQVSVSLNIDGDLKNDQREDLFAKARHMLGLDQDIESFESAHSSHEHLGKLLYLQGGLRIPQASSMIEAITWAIIGQQISLNAAISIRRRLVNYMDIRHSSGLLCYPDAEHISRLDVSDFGKLGFSLSKANTTLTVCKMMANGNLDLEIWSKNFDSNALRNHLIQIKGIGQWTINYVLLRGMGYMDGSLHGDAAVRNKLTRLLGLPNPISDKATELWLEAFKPWRSLVAAHLWAMPK